MVTEIEWHPKHITEVHRDELPAVTNQQIADFRRVVRTILGIPEPSREKNVFVPDPNILFVDATDADLAAIVDVLPACLADDYETWLWTISALRNASGGSSVGHHLAHVFSSKSSAYNRAEVDRKWRNPTRHDFSYLIGKARAADPTSPDAFIRREHGGRRRERALLDAISQKRQGGWPYRSSNGFGFLISTWRIVFSLSLLRRTYCSRSTVLERLSSRMTS